MQQARLIGINPFECVGATISAPMPRVETVEALDSPKPPQHRRALAPLLLPQQVPQNGSSVSALSQAVGEMLVQLSIITSGAGFGGAAFANSTATNTGINGTCSLVSAGALGGEGIF